MFLLGDSFNFIDRRLIVDAPTVTRTSDAYYKEADLVLTQVGPNEIRYLYDDEGNFAGFLLEPNEVQSVIKHSEVFSDDAFWTKDGLTLGSDVLGPDGVADSAVEISGTGTLEYHEKTISDSTFTFASSAQSARAKIECLPQVVGVAPTVHSIGTLQTTASDASALSMAWPSHATNDVCYIIAVDDVNNTTYPTLTGAAAADFSQLLTTGPSSATGGVRVRACIWWARAISGSMGTPGIQAPSFGGATYRAAISIVVRGSKTSGNPFAILNNSVNGTAGTSRTIPGGTATSTAALFLDVSSYGNDAATNAVTDYANASPGASGHTVHVAGAGTAVGNGGGLVLASFTFASLGYITGLTESMMRSSLFLRYVSGDPIVKLYNYRDADEAEFDLSTGELISGEGEAPEQYANGFWRIAATKDTGFISSEYGFGLEFDGVFHAFGANLTPTLLESQYVLNDAPMTGDTLVNNSGANLVYSNVPEPSPEDAGPNGDAVIWTAGTFNTGDRAIEDHILYQVTADPSTSTQPSVGAVAEPPSWVAVSPSNRWKMFSTETGVEVATVADGMIEFVIQSDLLLTDFSVHGVDAETCIITVYENGVPIFEKTIELITDYGIDDFYDWCLKERVYIRQFYESGIPWTTDSLLSVRFTNESGGPVTVGKFVPGVTVNVGILLDDVEIEARDFSRTSRNAFGIVTIAQGREVDIKRFRVAVDDDRVAYLIEKLKSLGVAATGWGVPGYDGAIVFGFRTKRDFRYSLIDSRAEITIEEV